MNPQHSPLPHGAGSPSPARPDNQVWSFRKRRLRVRTPPPLPTPSPYTEFINDRDLPASAPASPAGTRPTAPTARRVHQLHPASAPQTVVDDDNQIDLPPDVHAESIISYTLRHYPVPARINRRKTHRSAAPTTPEVQTMPNESTYGPRTAGSADCGSLIVLQGITYQLQSSDHHPVHNSRANHRPVVSCQYFHKRQKGPAWL